jgi:hypothetical protein
MLGESEPDPSGDNGNHHEIYCLAIADPIYKSSPKSNFDSSQVVYIVG